MARSSDAVAQPGPLLQAVGRLIRAEIEPNESALRTVALATGYEPSPTLIGEMFQWSIVLRTLKGQPSAAVRDAASVALTRRGLPPNVVGEVVETLTAASSVRLDTALSRAGEDAFQLPESVRGDMTRRSGRGWIRQPYLDVARVRAAAYVILAAVRGGLPLVLLLGLVLRVWLATTQSAWLDEAYTLEVWAKLPLGILLSAVKLSVHPPLYYAVLHIWLALTGFGVLEGRLLSVVFGVAAIAALYALTAFLFDKATALCAALLLAISPIASWYSDEVRMYAAADLFALLAVYLLLRAGRERHWRWWIGYVLCATLAFYLDSSGAYLVLAVNLSFVQSLARRQAPFWPWLASSAMVAFLSLPALLLLRFQAATNIGRIAWIPVPTASVVWASVRDVLNLNGDGVWTGLVFAALVPVAVLAFLRDRRQQGLQQVYLLLTFLIVTPLAVPLVLSAIHPVFITRTVQSAVYGLLILLARGIVLLLRTRFRVGLLPAIAIICLNATSLYAAAATPLKEDWQDLARYARGNVSAGSLILLDPAWLDSPFDLYWQPYRRQVALHDWPSITSETAAAGVFRGYNSVWLVAYYLPSGNPPIDEGTVFLREHYVPATTMVFYNLTLRHYVARGVLLVSAAALPDRVRKGSTTLISASTLPGAICTTRVVYDTDPGATGWYGAAQSADRQGTVAWRASVVTRANAGTVTVSCAFAGSTAEGTARLFISH